MFGKNENLNEEINQSCQTHVHEFLGSTQIAGPTGRLHNHRFVGVTSEVIPYGDSHIHAYLTNSDFDEGHLYEVGMVTGPAIPVENGRHVHLAKGSTTIDVGHFHDYIFTTLMD